MYIARVLLSSSRVRRVSDFSSGATHTTSHPSDIKIASKGKSDRFSFSLRSLHRDIFFAPYPRVKHTCHIYHEFSYSVYTARSATAPRTWAEIGLTLLFFALAPYIFCSFIFCSLRSRRRKINETHECMYLRVHVSCL